MLTDADVLAWLKSLGAPSGVEGWTIHRIDAAKQCQIGLFPRTPDYGSGVAIGGEGPTLTRTKNVQALVHWSRDANATEIAAQQLYDAIAAQATARPTIGVHTATYVQLTRSEPIGLGADESGTVERLIELTIYYQ